METTNNPDFKKPIKAKPHFYAVCLKGMQEIAKEHGYNLMVHGSMNRDMDLVAVAWVDNPSEHLFLIHALCDYLGVYKLSEAKDYGYSVLGGGRHSYVINLNRGSNFNGYLDEQYYIDLSITPFYKK